MLLDHRSEGSRTAFIQHHKGSVPYFTSTRGADATVVLSEEEKTALGIRHAHRKRPNPPDQDKDKVSFKRRVRAKVNKLSNRVLDMQV